MTSRERVLRALRHEEPDRVPLDMNGTFVTGIAATSLDRLRRKLGLEHRPVKVYDAYQMLGEVEMDVVERLQLDCLPVNPPAITMGLRAEDWKPWTLFDGTEVLMPGGFEVDVSPEGDWLFPAASLGLGPHNCRMPKDGFYFDTIGYADRHMDWEPPAFEDLKRASVNWAIRDADLQYLRDGAEPLRKQTDKCLVLGAWPYCGVHYIGSLTDWWTLLAARPDYVKDLFALSAEKSMQNLERLWEALGDSVDVIAVTGLDFGTQRATWFHPEVFREVYVPYLGPQFQWIRDHTTWMSFEHSCGSLAGIIGDMADYGLHALNPVQTSAAGMDPRDLKAKYGDRLAFWGGGVETQSTLPFGTPEEVRVEVTERVRIFAPGGGFVFNPVHNIQPKTPPENIIAAYDTALEVGRYPIS